MLVLKRIIQIQETFTGGSIGPNRVGESNGRAMFLFLHYCTRSRSFIVPEMPQEIIVKLKL
jgi:hypothetical protein